MRRRRQWLAIAGLSFASLLGASGLLAGETLVVPSPALQAVSPVPLTGPYSLMLYTRKGERVEARFSGQTYAAFMLTPAGRQAAPDGLYELQGGGTFRVARGMVVWADEIARRRTSLVKGPAGLA
jgi:hypothetical protein